MMRFVRDFVVREVKGLLLQTETRVLYNFYRSVTAGKHETVSHYISIAPNYSFLFALRLSVAATTHIPAS